MNERRRIPKWVLVGLFVLVAGIGGYRWHVERRGKAELAALVAQLEATDPTWTPDVAGEPLDVTADTVVAVIGRCQNLFPKFTSEFTHRTNGKAFMEGIPPNAQLDDEARVLLEHSLESCGPLRPIARSLADRPTGHRDFEPKLSKFGGREFTSDTSPHSMVRFVELEAERFNTLGDSERALYGVRVMCNIARIYDHPACLQTAYAVEERYRLALKATTMLERTLGMGTLRQGLASIQALLTTEMAVDYEALNRQAERVEIHTIYQWLERGEGSLTMWLELGAQTGGCIVITNSPEWKARAFAFRPHLYADHAASLQYYTQLVAIGQLPTHQRAAASYALTPTTDERYRLAQSLCKFDSLRSRRALNAEARVRCAVVALAAERYRQLVGQWPARIDDLPKTLLPDVPLDPFTGQALLLKQRADGLTIYSVGHDGLDGGGDVSLTHPYLSLHSSKDVGFRLYNPDQRRIAPVPVPREPAGSIPPTFGPMPREVP